MRRIIFLDMDGVIATPQVVHGGLWRPDPNCQDQLARVLNATGAELVISSSWRLNTISETMVDLTSKGFRFSDRITGVTIRAYNYIREGIAMSIPRGVEIRQWLDHNIHSGGNGLYVPGRNGTYVRRNLGIDYQYVILDDDTDMLLEQAEHFVQCEPLIGLTAERADAAIEILLQSEGSPRTSPPSSEDQIDEPANTF